MQLRKNKSSRSDHDVNCKVVQFETRLNIHGIHVGCIRTVGINLQLKQLEQKGCGSFGSYILVPDYQEQNSSIQVLRIDSKRMYPLYVHGT